MSAALFRKVVTLAKDRESGRYVSEEVQHNGQERT